MTRDEAFMLLGGSATAAAKAIGCSLQAVCNWPGVLTPKLADRVQAALYRQHLQVVQVMAMSIEQREELLEARRLKKARAHPRKARRAADAV